MPGNLKSISEEKVETEVAQGGLWTLNFENITNFAKVLCGSKVSLKNIS